MSNTFDWNIALFTFKMERHHFGAVLIWCWAKKANSRRRLHLEGSESRWLPVAPAAAELCKKKQQAKQASCSTATARDKYINNDSISLAFSFFPPFFFLSMAACQMMEIINPGWQFLLWKITQISMITCDTSEEAAMTSLVCHHFWRGCVKSI